MPTNQKKTAKLFAIASILVALLLWTIESITPNNLDFQVATLYKVSVFETPYLYYLVHAFSLIPVFLLSFDKKVHFYKKWKYLFPAIAIVALIFILWDILFTEAGVWGFNENYYIEGTKLLGLPLEEWLFFFTVPYASVFIYECLKCYEVSDFFRKADKWISYALMLFFISLATLYIDRAYTAITGVLSAGFVAWHFLSQKNTYRTRFYFSYLLTLIPFLLVDGVLTGAATNAPIVLYNPEEFAGLRIISIPIEDAIYGFLMVFGIVHLFERFRRE